MGNTLKKGLFVSVRMDAKASYHTRAVQRCVIDEMSLWQVS